MKKEIKKIIFLSTVLLPSMVFAAPTLEQLLTNFGSIINKIVPLIFALAFVFLLWNISLYVQGGNPSKVKEAGEMIFYSIFALFVMVSVWGLVAVIQNTLNIKNERVTIPTVLGR